MNNQTVERPQPFQWEGRTFYQPKSKRAQVQIEKARFLLNHEGVHAAAEYLRQKAWSCEAALFILLGR